MKKISKSKQILCAGLLSTFCFLAVRTAYADSLPQESLANDEEYWLEWGELVQKEKVTILFDQSGSSRGSQTAASLKNIVLEVLCQDLHTECTLLGFDETCDFVTEKAAKKITGKETDLLNALQCADNFVLNGKSPTNLIVLSDFYDTSSNKVKLNPQKEQELLLDRQSEIKNICEGWKDNEYIKNSYYYWWDAPKEQTNGYLCSIPLGKSEIAKQKDIDVKKKQCVRDALNIITGRNDLEWENYGDILPEDEKNYIEYYLYTEDEIAAPDSIKEDQEFKEIDAAGKTEGNIYHVKNINMEQLGLRRSLYQSSILRVPQLKMTLSSGQVWDKSDVAKEGMDVYVAIDIDQDGKKVVEPDFTIYIECTPKDHTGPQLIKMLEYDESEEHYYQEFPLQSAGEYDIRVYMKKENEERELGKTELLVEKSDICLLETSAFAEKLEHVTKKGRNIDLKEHFENYDELTFTFQTGEGIQYSFDDKTYNLKLVCEDDVKQDVQSFIIVYAKYKEEENAGKPFRFKIYTSLQAAAD